MINTTKYACTNFEFDNSNNNGNTNNDSDDWKNTNSIPRFSIIADCNFHNISPFTLFQRHELLMTDF